MARAAVKRGLRLSVGSWNTIWMRLRIGSVANFLAGIAPMSSPSNWIRPSVASISRMTMVEVVDLPQPDSPTRPTLSPRPTVKLMPSTARKVSGSGAGPRRNSAGQRFDRALARIFLHQLLDHEQRRLVGARAAAPAPSGGPRRPRAAGRAATRRARRRAHQPARIGMLRRGEDRAGGRGLDHVALLHHRHPVAIGRGQPEVVGDQDGGHAALLGQLDHEVHHGLLGGHVEAGGRLVGDQELRPAGERERDDDALAHAAGQFERIGVVALARARDAHLLEQLDRLGGGVLRARLGVLHQHVLDLAADLADRIERGARVLEDHRHFAAAQVAHLGFAGGADVEAGEGDASLRRCGRRGRGCASPRRR